MMEEMQSPDTSVMQEEAEQANVNLAEDLDDDKLAEIGAQCRDGFNLDLESRSEWEHDL